MERIKVMQILAGLAIGSRSGGAELTGLQIARHLDRDEFSPALFVMFRYDDPAEKAWLEQLDREGIPVYGLLSPGGNLPMDLLKMAPRLWEAVSIFRPDVLNSHSERGDFLNSLARVFHPLHPRSARTVHLVRQWSTRPALGSALSQLVFPLVIDADLAVSDPIAGILDRRLLNRLVKKRAVVCYNGIEADYFLKPASRSMDSPLPEGLPASGPRVGIIGRLSPEKGHSLLLEAISIVLRQKKVQLIVVGSGALEEDLKRRSMDLGIAGSVHFLGSRGDIIHILGGLDLLVSASAWEAFPTVILEAISQLVPVVATDVPGNRDILQNGETGLLVPAGDAGALAEGILMLLAQPQMAQEMARRARQSAARFTIQNTAACHAGVYRKITRQD